MNNQSINAALLKPVHCGDVGVKAHQKYVLGEAKRLHRIGSTHAGGFVESQQDVDLRIFFQKCGGVGLGMAGLSQRVDVPDNLRPAALGEGVDCALFPFLAVGAADIIVDNANLGGPLIRSRADWAAICPAA